MQSVLDQEIIALQEIYITELTYNKDAKENELVFFLSPATGEKTQDQWVSMYLFVQPASDYPFSIPMIEIRNPRGLTQDHTNRIEQSLLELAERCRGDQMIFQLVELAKEILTNVNVPHVHCTICLEDLSTSSSKSFVKTQCTHYFHKNCLGRYLAYVSSEDNTRDNTRSDLATDTSDPSEVPCPVCRKDISESCKTAEDETTLGDDATPCKYVPDDAMIRLQERMQRQLEVQRSKGGVIDKEAEKKKYDLPKDFVYQGLKEKEEKSKMAANMAASTTNSSQSRRSTNSNRYNNRSYKRYNEGVKTFDKSKDSRDNDAAHKDKSGDLSGTRHKNNTLNQSERHENNKQKDATNGADASSSYNRNAFKNYCDVDAGDQKGVKANDNRGYNTNHNRYRYRDNKGDNRTGNSNDYRGASYKTNDNRYRANIDDSKKIDDNEFKNTDVTNADCRNSNATTDTASNETILSKRSNACDLDAVRVEPSVIESGFVEETKKEEIKFTPSSDAVENSETYGMDACLMKEMPSIAHDAPQNKQRVDMPRYSGHYDKNRLAGSHVGDRKSTGEEIYRENAFGMTDKNSYMTDKKNNSYNDRDKLVESKDEQVMKVSTKSQNESRDKAHLARQYSSNAEKLEKNDGADGLAHDPTMRSCRDKDDHVNNNGPNASSNYDNRADTKSSIHYDNRAETNPPKASSNHNDKQRDKRRRRKNNQQSFAKTNVGSTLEARNNNDEVGINSRVSKNIDDNAASTSIDIKNRSADDSSTVNPVISLSENARESFNKSSIEKLSKDKVDSDVNIKESTATNMKESIPEESEVQNNLANNGGRKYRVYYNRSRYNSHTSDSIDDRKSNYDDRKNNSNNIKSSYNDRKNHYDDRKSNYDDYKNNYDDRKNNYNDRKSNYDDRKSNHDDYKNNYNDRKNNYNDRKSNYDDLKNNYNDHKGNYNRKSNYNDGKSNYIDSKVNYGDRKSNNDDSKNNYKRTDSTGNDDSKNNYKRTDSTGNNGSNRSYRRDRYDSGNKSAKNIATIKADDKHIDKNGNMPNNSLSVKSVEGSEIGKSGQIKKSNSAIEKRPNRVDRPRINSKNSDGQSEGQILNSNNADNQSDGQIFNSNNADSQSNDQRPNLSDGHCLDSKDDVNQSDLERLNLNKNNQSYRRSFRSNYNNKKISSISHGKYKHGGKSVSPGDAFDTVPN